MTLRKWAFVLLAAFVLSGISTPVRAQGGPGVQGGLSLNPDQFYFGGHFEFGPVTDKLWFRPNVNVGFGDNLTLIAVNVELAYWISHTRLKDWKLYLGGGPAINYYNLDTGPLGGLGIDDSTVEPGLNFLFGIANRKGLFFEFKIGVLDSPDLRFGVGYTFYEK